MNWFGLQTLFAQFPTLSSLYHLPYISYHWDSFMRTHFIFREFSDDRKLICSALVLLFTVVQFESGQSWNCFNVLSVLTCFWHNTLYFSSMVLGLANKKRNRYKFKCLNLWSRPSNLLQKSALRESVKVQQTAAKAALEQMTKLFELSKCKGWECVFLTALCSLSQSIFLSSFYMKRPFCFNTMTSTCWKANRHEWTCRLEKNCTAQNSNVIGHL